MEFIDTLSKPSSKIIEKSEHDQATLGLTKGNEDELDLIISDLYKRAEDQCKQIISNISSEAEYGQETSEFTTSYDNQKLADGTEIDGTEVEFDRIISDLFDRVEDQYNQIISIIRSNTEYNQMTSEFATSYDNQELINGTKAGFDPIISDLFKGAEEQLNQIISITKSEA